MSDDLISRKALMERVLQEEYDNDIRKDGRTKAIHHVEYQHFYMTIAETQTAYDVDKVIERLQEELSLSDKEKERCARENSLQFDVAKGYAHGIAVSLEIVKSGGVANE
ncbi:MAG: hypothetical protein HFH72_09305 [Lachnospiraceae bacterium]|nr:hypothetical protein [Lachnospiraceae bacterium]